MDPSGVLRISYIKLENARKIRSVNLSFDGQRHKICQAQTNVQILQENFNPFLELRGRFTLTLTYHKQFIVKFPGKTVEIPFDAAEVLSRLDNNKYQYQLATKPDVLLEIATADVNVTQEPVSSTSSHNPEPWSAGQLKPTTEDFLNECRRFRLLVLGKSGIGKSTLINRAFGIKEALTADNRPGAAKIEEALESPENERFILHDSQGFESGDDANYALAKKFIQGRKVHPDVSERLHAIWLCFQIPLEEHGERFMERGTEAFLKEKKKIVGNIPTIVVFTKYDKLFDHLESKDLDAARIKAAATRHLQKNCVDHIAKLTGEEDFPYVTVSNRGEFKEMYQQLIELTSNLVSKHFEPRMGSRPSAVPVVTAMAQRVAPRLKIEASIRVGKSRYWRAVFSTPEFFGYTVAACLCVIHTDIVNVWNFHDPSNYLTSKRFQEMMAGLVEDAAPDPPSNSEEKETEPILPLLTLSLPIMAGTALLRWLYNTYQRVPGMQQRFIAYIVDLTHIMSILFNLAESDKPLTRQSIKIAVQTYSDSPLRRGVHCTIRELRDALISGQSLLGKIELLVHDRIEECSSLKPVKVADLDQDEDWNNILAGSCPAE